MTNTQSDLIVQLKNQILAGYGPSYEYKQFRITEYPGERWCALSAVVGPIGDEGTIASILYRNIHVLWVGPRGRIIPLAEPEQHGPQLLSLKQAMKQPIRIGAASDGTGHRQENHGHA